MSLVQLSRRNAKLLTKLTPILTPDEVALLREKWQLETIKPPSFLQHLVSKSIMPVMTIVMVAVNMYPAVMGSWGNIVIALIWAFLILLAPAIILLYWVHVKAVVSIRDSNLRVRLLSSRFLRDLRPRSLFRSVYEWGMLLVLIGATAAAGHIFTAVCLILSTLCTWFFLCNYKEALRDNLRVCARSRAGVKGFQGDVIVIT